MSLEPTQEDIELLMSPNKVMEIEVSTSDPISPVPFDRKKAKQMLLDIHPDADVTTIEACLSLSLHRHVTKIPLPKTVSDIIQQIDDLLNEDAAPPTQPEVFKTPKIVCTPEAQAIQDRCNSV